MNSDTKLTVEELTKDVGAVVPCSRSGNCDVDAGDSEAEKMLMPELPTFGKMEIEPSGT